MRRHATATKATFFCSLADSRAAANKAFAAMSLPEKRVRIAKDVIEGLDLRSIVAERGTYLGSDVYTSMRGKPAEASLQETLKGVEQCHVCAKGAIFLCAVGRQNNVTHIDTHGESFGGYSLQEKLGGIFEADQLNKIESAFEGWNNRYVNDVELRDKLYAMNAEQRMRSVMLNIIRNNGEFVPTRNGTCEPLKSPAQVRDGVVAALGL